MDILEDTGDQMRVRNGRNTATYYKGIDDADMEKARMAGKNTSTYGAGGIQNMPGYGDYTDDEEVGPPDPKDQLAKEQYARIQQHNNEQDNPNPADPDRIAASVNKFKDFFRTGGAVRSHTDTLSPNDFPARDYGPPRDDGTRVATAPTGKITGGGQFKAQPAPDLSGVGGGDDDAEKQKKTDFKAAGGKTTKTTGTGAVDTSAIKTVATTPVAAKTNALGEAGKLPPDEQAFYDRAKKIIGARSTGMNLKPLAALIDTWYGGNLAGAYEKPLSIEEKDDKLLGLDKAEAERKTALGERFAELQFKREAAMKKAMAEAKVSKLEQQNFLLKYRAAQGKGGKEPKHVMFDDPTIADVVSANAKDPKGWNEFLRKNKGDPASYAEHVSAIAAQYEKTNPGLPHRDAVLQAAADVRRHGLPTKPKTTKNQPFYADWFKSDDAPVAADDSEEEE